jgi:hypothetical protein
MNKTYNIATGVPGDLLAQVDSLKLDLTWSRHAKEEAVHDKYGVLPVGSYPKQILVREWQVVEVEAANGYTPVKLVVRRAADAKRSLVLVLLLDGRTTAIVKTTWSNLNSDNHKTLDKTRFARE